MNCVRPAWIHTVTDSSSVPYVPFWRDRGVDHVGIRCGHSVVQLGAAITRGRDASLVAESGGCYPSCEHLPPSQRASGLTGDLPPDQNRDGVEDLSEGVVMARGYGPNPYGPIRVGRGVTTGIVRPFDGGFDLVA